MNNFKCPSNMNTQPRPFHLLNVSHNDRASLVISYMFEDFAGLDGGGVPWRRRVRPQGTDEPCYNLGLNEAARGRLHALAGLLKMSRAEVEQWYAEYWLTYTVLAAYAQPLQATGWRLVQLLVGLDGLIQRARTLMPRLNLPGFETLEVEGDALVIRLRETRSRGHSFLRGMLRRLAADFGVEVDLSEAGEYGSAAVRLRVVPAVVAGDEQGDEERNGWEDFNTGATAPLPVRRWRSPLSMPARRTQPVEALLAA
jgi:hypothetical protein